MTRRGLFGLLFGSLVAKFIPVRDYGDAHRILDSTFHGLLKSFKKMPPSQLQPEELSEQYLTIGCRLHDCKD